MSAAREAEHDRGRGLVQRHKALYALLALALAVPVGWGIRLWQLRSDVDRYRQYWSTPRGEPGGIVYVALGDSTAQGIGASSPERGYVGLIAQRLRAATGRPVLVINLSVSGARVHDVVADQLPKLAGLSPDVVTVAVGANDIRSYEIARFSADVDALVAGLPAKAVVGDVPWFMHGGTGRRSDQAAGYVARVARSRDLSVAGLHDATQRRGWSSMITDFAADWFHPRDRGHRVWAGAYWEAMVSGPALKALELPGS
jgi:acyl-CoA thioesterase-1